MSAKRTVGRSGVDPVFLFSHPMSCKVTSVENRLKKNHKLITVISSLLSPPFLNLFSRSIRSINCPAQGSEH
jgi:hypothetical protein